MSDTKIRVKHWTNTEDRWQSSPLSGVTLLKGELAFIESLSSNSVMMKVGDGQSSISRLPYVRLHHDMSQDIIIATRDEWEHMPSFQPRRGQIVVWSDKDYVERQWTDENGFHSATVPVPGFKIGDGNAYNIDLPFSDDAVWHAIECHQRDLSCHLNDGERDKWNHKITIEDNEVINETLKITRN